MSTQPESQTEGEVVSPPSQDQLPDYEPLTPELVEDEAVRGDFVIRWAVVLLALLFGWTQIDDTSLLVRIRNGQQHLLPFGNDTFSASAADRSWVNLGWLSDPLLAAIYGVGGARGLTILGAMTSALTFWWLSRTSLKGVSTWWGSVCGMIALVALFPQMVPGPTGLTLLGVAYVVFQLFHWSEERTGHFRWQLPIGIWIWSQLDPRAWVGVAIVVLYALSWVGLRGTEEGDSPQLAKTLWKMTGAVLLAWVIHPQHYHVALSPWTAYGVEYPELRAYRTFDWPQAWQWFPMYADEFQSRLDRFSIAGIILVGLVVLTLLLNFRRITWEWVLPWAGMVGLAVMGAHQLPIAALLSCALITLNAQIWYRATCSQAYTVDAMPLAWNRGGRAVTVVALLMLGLIAINGQLMGRDGRRIGAGFTPQMSTSLMGAEKLAGEVATKEVFNFRLEQGDLLIWAGLKPYVDRRLTLYAAGPDNLLEKHRKLRQSMLNANAKFPQRGQPEFWKAEFDRLKINQAIPRLSGPSPDYSTLIEMLQQGWALSSLQSFGAVLSRTESPDKSFEEYRKSHEDVDFIQQAFRTEPPKTPPTEGPWIFPRRPTVYDNYLWKPQTTLNEPLQLASHEQALVQILSAVPAEDEATLMSTAALAMSALRHARQGIILDPQSARGYHTLAQAASYLYQVDALISNNFQIPYPSRIWLAQSLHAYNHLLLLDSENASAHEELASLLLQQGKRDLALTHMQQVYRLTGSYSTVPVGDPRHEQATKVNQEVVTELKRHLKTVTENALKAVSDGSSWDKSLQAAMQGQCPGLALQYMESNRTEVAKNPELQMLQVNLLIDSGRTEDALQQAESLFSLYTKPGSQAPPTFTNDVRLVYGIASLAVGDNSQLEAQLAELSQAMSATALLGVLDQAPFAAGPGPQLDLLPAAEGVTGFQALYQAPDNWAADELMQAQSELSTWANSKAEARLQAILELHPNASVRPLVSFYLTLLTGKAQDPVSPEQKNAMQKAAASQKPMIGPPVAPLPAVAPPAIPGGTPAPDSKQPTDTAPSEAPAAATAPPNSEPPPTTPDETQKSE